jgi:hypothetical protein
MDKIWGCEEKCMFCNEPCKNTDKSHVSENIDHHCIQHRPNGISGFFNVSDKSVCVDFCNSLIQSTKRYSINCSDYKDYKEYKAHYPDWYIQPTYDTSKYWMYVLCKYQQQLTDLYCSTLPHLPTTWNDITKEEAIDSLS